MVSRNKSTIAHQCAGAPDFIIVVCDYRTAWSDESRPAYVTLVQLAYFKGFTKTFTTLSTSGSLSTSAAIASRTADGHIVDVTDESFSINCASNRRLGKGLAYRWYAIRVKEA